MKTRILPLVIISMILLVGSISGQTIDQPTVIDKPGSYVVGNSFFSYSSHGIIVAVSDVYLDGQGCTITGQRPHSGIFIKSGLKNIHIKDCRIKNFEDGIYAGSSQRIIIEHNFMDNNTEGIRFGSTTGSRISHNTIRGGEIGVNFLNSSNHDTVSYNTIDKSSFISIHISFQSEHNSLIYNSIINGQYEGIFVNLSDNNEISNNTGQASVYGIYINNSTSNYGVNNYVSGGQYNSVHCTDNGNNVENYNVSFCGDKNNILREFWLSQNFPNPFNPSTIISYQIPKASHVILKIYNLTGQEVAALVDEHQTSGNYQIEFDASHLPSGIYFYHLKTEKFSKVMKMILQK